MRFGSPKEAGRLSAPFLGLPGLCLWISVGCIVPTPKPEEILAAATGFRTPEQTFRTFQTASAANLADLEYRCFSVGFRDRNGISKLNYLEVRDELRGPGFKYAVYRAEILSVDVLGPDRRRILARAVGRTLVVDMVREDFYELWTTDGLLDSGDTRFEAATRVIDGSVVEVHTPSPPGSEPRDLVEISVRREWKIDGYEIRDEEPAAAPATAETP